MANKKEELTFTRHKMVDVFPIFHVKVDQIYHALPVKNGDLLPKIVIFHS